MPALCKTCGQALKEDEGRHEEQQPVVAADSKALPVDTGFCAAFDALALSVPPSVRRTAIAKLERAGFDPMAEDPLVASILEKAKTTYLRKKERSRASTAARSKKKKELEAAGDDA